ncbi:MULTISPECIES: flavin reductase [unclassified Streptomyces]|uniref:flavin reductase n=1 Tax=unclassified Streptomyces TaxID=2593676 RepID=UPI0022373721|nr:flavin reductase [Streptomyces sp. SHP 1-2]MCW5251315.1 flavin reductase [Streptomyces sp. SHP 1-2]
MEQAPLDQTLFRHVIGHFASGVAVITTREGDTDHGMTVSAVSSLSLDPPMLLVCAHTKAPTHAALHRAGVFCVNVLGENQEHLASQFAGPRADKFAGVAHERGARGMPVLTDALAVLECEVVEDIVGGTHRVFLARVLGARAREGSPLAYFRGGFGRFEPARHTVAHERLRDLVISRRLPPDTGLRAEDLAALLDTPVAAAHYAVTRLVGEGLIGRDPERGHVLLPLARASVDAFDGRLALEIGVAAGLPGPLDPAAVRQWREIADRAGKHVAHGRITDTDGYLTAIEEFHEYLIGLAGNPSLRRIYRRLGTPGLMAAALSGSDTPSAHAVEEHHEIIDAFAAGDFAGIKRVLTLHNQHTKQAQHHGVGGEAAAS